MQEFTSVAEMQAHYKAVRARCRFNKGYTPPEPESGWEIVKPAIRAWIAPEVTAPVKSPIAALVAAWKLPDPNIPLPTRIMRAVARYYNLTVTDLCGERRESHIVRPRQVAMYLMHHLTLRSYPDIGRRLGNRDHTTALHGVRRITEFLAAGDSSLRQAVDTLTAELRP